MLVGIGFIVAVALDGQALGDDDVADATRARECRANTDHATGFDELDRSLQRGHDLAIARIGAAIDVYHVVIVTRLGTARAAGTAVILIVVAIDDGRAPRMPLAAHLDAREV